MTDEAPTAATMAATMTAAAPDAGANNKGRLQRADPVTKARAKELGIRLSKTKPGAQSGTALYEHELQQKIRAKEARMAKKRAAAADANTMPAGAPAGAHGDRDTGADHDTGSDQATNDRENNDGSDRDVSDSVPEWSAGDAEDAAEDDGGGSMSHDSFRAPHDQKCAAPPNEREKRGLKRFAEVDISNCSVCNERLRPLGNHVASFQPCDECLDKLKEMTDAYDTACLCPNHASRRVRTRNPIAHDGYGKLYQESLLPTFNGRPRFIRFDRSGAEGFCKQCYDKDGARRQASQFDPEEQSALDMRSKVDISVFVPLKIEVKVSVDPSKRRDFEHIISLVTAQSVVEASKDTGYIERQFTNGGFKVKKKPDGNVVFLTKKD